MHTGIFVPYVIERVSGDDAADEEINARTNPTVKDEIVFTNTSVMMNSEIVGNPQATLIVTDLRRKVQL